MWTRFLHVFVTGVGYVLVANGVLFLAIIVAYDLGVDNGFTRSSVRESVTYDLGRRWRCVSFSGQTLDDVLYGDAFGKVGLVWR